MNTLKRVIRTQFWWKRPLMFLVIALVYALPFLTVTGAVQIYLKLGTIKGESKDKGHEEWIKVNSFQFGAGRTISRQSGTLNISAVTVSDVVVTKPTDITTPPIFARAVGQVGSETATIDFVNTSASTQPFYQVILSDVLVSGFSQSSGGDVPFESISLNYGKIEMKYTTIDPDTGKAGASASASYDISTGKQ